MDEIMEIYKDWKKALDGMFKKDNAKVDKDDALNAYEKGTYRKTLGEYLKRNSDIQFARLKDGCGGYRANSGEKYVDPFQIYKKVVNNPSEDKYFGPALEIVGNHERYSKYPGRSEKDIDRKAIKETINNYPANKVTIYEAYDRLKR